MLRRILGLGVAASWLCLACGGGDSSGLGGALDGGAASGGSAGSGASGGSAGTSGSGGSAAGGAGGSAGMPGGCVNSLDCTPPQVCDTMSSRCVECTGDNDCSGGKSCRGQKCVTIVPCQSDNMCTPLGLLCDPVSQTCVQCVQQSDCTQAGWSCVQGECRSQLCTPGENFCDAGSVKECDSTGQAGSVVDDCNANQYCDATLAQCRPKLCQPNQPACDGSVATLCNGNGSGYQAGGTNCSSSGKTCVNGACQSCPAGGVDQLRISEFFLGTDDYVVLENHSTSCSANLNGMTLDFRSSDTSSNVVVTLPNRTLAPGAKVFVVEQNDAKPGDIDTGLDLSIVSDLGINVLLCQGSCINLASIVDVLSVQGNQQPPPLPPGVTFTPSAISGVTLANEETHAYKRKAYAGGAPAFVASDYGVAPASRPFVNSANCPATQPSGTCTQMNLTCVYPPAFCVCALSTWICQ